MNEVKIKTKDKAGAYFGNVLVTLKHGTKTYDVIKGHNAGTKEFFAYTLNCIRGYNDYNNRPGYIYLYADTSFNVKAINTPILYSDVSEPVGLDGIPSAGTLDSASMTYTFLVPDTLISGKTISALQLVSLADREVYAEIVFPEAIVISDNTNIVIDWTLNLSNQIERV